MLIPRRCEELQEASLVEVDLLGLARQQRFLDWEGQQAELSPRPPADPRARGEAVGARGEAEKVGKPHRSRFGKKDSFGRCCGEEHSNSSVQELADARMTRHVLLLSLLGAATGLVVTPIRMPALHASTTLPLRASSSQLRMLFGGAQHRRPATATHTCHTPQQHAKLSLPWQAPRKVATLASPT
jgi:hypothetical protein